MRAWLLALCLCCACHDDAKLERYGQLPQFTLKDQRAQTFTRATLQGRVAIVDFIFTSCPDVCPLLTEQLTSLRKQLPQDAQLAYVSISVDPAHDTPERLQEFAKQHGAAHDDFFFLTGPADEVKRVVTSGFKQAMELQPVREGQPRNVLHGTHFVLVDRTGEIRGFFANDADGQAALKRAANTLIADSPKS